MAGTLHRFKRASVAFGHDLVMAAVSIVLSLYLRLGEDLFQYQPQQVALATGLFVIAAAPVFWFNGLYRGVWRYASLNDLVAIVRAVTVAMLVFLPLLFVVNRLEGLPRSLLVINWFVLIGLLSGPRLIYRMFKDRHMRHVLERSGARRVPVLLVGAGDEAELFIREMARQSDAPYRVLGVIDEKGNRVGRRIRGMEVLGDIDALPAVCERLARRGPRPERLIVTKPNLDAPVLGALVERADTLGMTIARLPRLTELKHGTSDRLETRPIAIEDLLGRPQAVLDRPAMRALVEGRRVLVTGAGGTIGGELVRQIAELAPARLTLLDAGEYNLYAIDGELAATHPSLPRAAVLANVRDRGRIDALFAAHRPELVFHAAALKHVPLVEAHPAEGVLTNVIGTRNVADAARAHGAEAMVLISTDKAVNPVSVMGASKRLAESYAQALDIHGAGGRNGPHFVTVRFGNVLGSSGSVVPLFQQQLARGGPLTVTHPQATRYFMTVREAVELVLQASAHGVRRAEDAGCIYVLDMGEPVKIVELARQMIRLAGLTPDRDVEIRFIGLRPGERLYEDLFHDLEALQPTAADGVHLASPRAADQAVLARALVELEQAATGDDAAQCLALLRRLVPEYTPAGAAPAVRPVTAQPAQ